MSCPTAIAVIPARFASSRFPGKPLADRTGKPLIAHVVDRVRQAKRIDQIIVATDDQRIFETVTGFGGHAVMTRHDHPNGTSRVAEVIAGLGGDDPINTPAVVVNVQGDEPQIEPALIDQLVEGLLAQPTAGGAPMATVASAFEPNEDPRDPHIVKVVARPTRFGLTAVYFSRSLIPFDRDLRGDLAPAKPMKHIGLYAYRPDFLLRYVTLPATPLEQTEQLEQLRAVEHGFAIAVVVGHSSHHGIDTPEQYEAFVRWHADQSPDAFQRDP